MDLADLNLNGDGQLDNDDVAFLIENLVQTTNGQVGTFILGGLELRRNCQRPRGCLDSDREPEQLSIKLLSRRHQFRLYRQYSGRCVDSGWKSGRNQRIEMGLINQDESLISSVEPVRHC